MSNPLPSIATHIPITTELPQESNNPLVGREDLPTPSLWQKSVQVRHKITSKRAVVVRVDYGTNMFRAFYPDDGDIDPQTKKPVGVFSSRTEWQHCRDWDVDVTFSPAELDRQAAVKRLQAEMDRLDKDDLDAVSALVDESDPRKALAKLEALRRLGVINVSPAAAQAAVETKGKK